MMRTSHALLLVALMPAAVSAQKQSPVPPQAGANPATADSCRLDLQKFCTRASLKAECLVQHWTKISDDCQNALSRPIRGGGGGGG
ncbi:hypothetical protein [Sphingomonas quercus]|uniref:Cysteine rich repeat-containing protein n=1 Tax=Sphingomonas quercus TaxID=2842451 RepID=A0ABS6BLS7_9SPHN|nr:hypothetical protein [Sphingomonas quercus]MBU3078792.1 hypothetical protein [Sphingomonas quercus]